MRASYAFGWVKTTDLALVNSDFIKRFKNGNYAMVIKDNLRLYDSNKPLSLVKIGALFPIAKDGKHYLTASRDSKGRAHIQKVKTMNER